MNLKKVSGCNKSMAQNKSLLIVNDSKIKTRKINIKDLYNGKYQWEKKSKYPYTNIII